MKTAIMRDAQNTMKFASQQLVAALELLSMDLPDLSNIDNVSFIKYSSGRLHLDLNFKQLEDAQRAIAELTERLDLTFDHNTETSTYDAWTYSANNFTVRIYLWR